MIKRVNVSAGYQRAAAGVMGCVLVGSALGIALHEREPVSVIPEQKLSAPLSELTPEAVGAQDVDDDTAYLALSTRLKYKAMRESSLKPQIASYKVKNGDSLWSIAVTMNTDMGTLMALNQEINPDILQPGQELRVVRDFRGLPYTVQAGDSVTTLAAAYNVPEHEIRSVNRLDTEGTLQPGSTLFLPGARPRVSRNVIASRSAFVRPRTTEAVPLQTAEGTVRPAAEGAWVWPIVGGLHSSEFGRRWGGMHNGIDIAIRTGTPAVAVQAGTVVFSGWDGGYGYSVIVDHGGGIKTRYAHASALLVTTGQTVEQGTPLMKVGSTGNSTGPHLHFEVLVNGTPQNPREYLP